MKKVLKIESAKGSKTQTIVAKNGEQYVLTDAQTEKSPKKIKLIKKGENLEIFTEANEEIPSLVVENYYSEGIVSSIEGIDAITNQDFVYSATNTDGWTYPSEGSYAINSTQGVTQGIFSNSFLVLGVLSGVGLSALKGSSSSSNSTNTDTSTASSTGYFVDSGVEGADYYINGVLAGKTGTDGSFTYKAGDKVTFKIANIEIGEIDTSTLTDEYVTIQDVVGVDRDNLTDERVIAIAQFLQTLDSDGDSTTINIPSDTELSLKLDTTTQYSFRDKDNLPSLETAIFKSGVTIVTKETAMNHVVNVLKNKIGLAINTAGPTVDITLNNSKTNSTNTSIVTFKFSEPIVEFDINKVAVTYGTLTDLTQVSDRVYTAILHSRQDSEIEIYDARITLFKDSFQDTMGNYGRYHGMSYIYQIDTKHPSLFISISESTINSGQTAKVTFAFSEKVTGFTIDDIEVSNGTLQDLNSIDGGKTWTATFVPTEDIFSDINTISVKNDSYTDLMGNTGLVEVLSNSYSINTQIVDTIEPSLLSISISKTTINSGQTADVTFIFSEEVTGFEVEDIEVSNGTLENLQSIDGKTYTATFIPNQNILSTTNTISIKNTASYTDLTGNTGLAEVVSGNYSIDTKTPEITMDDYSLSLVEWKTKVTIDFKEGVTDFTIDDLTAENGTLSELVQDTTNPNIWTATFKLPALKSDGSTNINDASNTISLKNTYSYASGETGMTSKSQNYTIDNITPMATITSSKNLVLTGETANITFTFTEKVTGFEVGDIQVDNGELTNFKAASTDGKIYTATFTPKPYIYSQYNYIKIIPGTYTDLQGNPGVISSLHFEVNTNVPEISIDKNILGGNDTMTITAKFKGDTTEFFGRVLLKDGEEWDTYREWGDISDFTNDSNDLRTWTATFTPKADIVKNSITVYYHKSGYSEAEAPETISFDTKAPTISSIEIISSEDVDGNNSLSYGDILSTKVTMSEIVNVTGSPILKLNIGGTLVDASYDSGDGTNELIFKYTLLEGQSDSNGINIDANALIVNESNGDKVQDLFQNNLTLTSGLVTDNPLYVI